MKRIFLILAIMIVFGIVKSYAGERLAVYASTSSATISSGPCRIDEFDVESTTTTIQTITFYDNDVAKWVMIVPPYSATNGTGFRDIHLSTYLKFYTNCTVKASTNPYGNNAVLVQVINQ